MRVSGACERFKERGSESGDGLLRCQGALLGTVCLSSRLVMVMLILGASCCRAPAPHRRPICPTQQFRVSQLPHPATSACITAFTQYVAVAAQSWSACDADPGALNLILLLCVRLVGYTCRLLPRLPAASTIVGWRPTRSSAISAHRIAARLPTCATPDLSLIHI